MLRKKAKSLILLIIVLLYLFLIGACQGDIGLTGSNGIVIPGGSVTLSYPALASATDTVIIVFDTNTTIDEGDEYRVSIPFADHFNIDTIDATLTWRASNLPYGSYYIYAWADINDDGVFDNTGFELSSMYIFGDTTTSSGYSFSVPDQIVSTYGTISPNYTYWDNYAATLNIVIE